MATIVNTPATRETSDSWIGTVIGILVVGFLLILFFAYGLPFLRSAMSNGGQSGVNINVPDKIDINTDKTLPQQQ